MLGLLERENPAILNESLKPLAKKTITVFKTAPKKLGFTFSFSLKEDGKSGSVLVDKKLLLKDTLLTTSLLDKLLIVN